MLKRNKEKPQASPLAKPQASPLASERLNFLKSIDYLTEEDVFENIPTVEKLKRIDKSLDEYNPLTYAILLNSPKIKDVDREYYQEVYNRLLQREQITMKNILERFQDSSSESYPSSSGNINSSNPSNIL